MTEPSSARPIPGPPRPGPSVPGSTTDDQGQETSFEDLGQRPVAEHVAVFETEHVRLQRELGTIDQL
jgi:hypothetical protein